MRSPKINLYIYSQLIFSKSVRKIQWGKESFQPTVFGKLDTHVQKGGFMPVSHHTQTLTQNGPGCCGSVDGARAGLQTKGLPL